MNQFKIILLLLTVLFSFILLFACNSIYNETAVKTSSTAVSSDIPIPSLKTVYNDKIVSLYFIKKYETPGINGMFFIDLKAENKSNKEITVYLKDASINDSMITFVSGAPLTVLPGKIGTNAFAGKCETVGIKDADDIKKIGFKIYIMDESANTIETTKPVEIDF